MHRNSGNVSTVQQRIAAVAQRSPKIAFTSLAHYIDLEWLIEAYHRTRKDGAVGIDDVTGKQYAENLHDNLQGLLDRLKSGTYWGKTRKGKWAVSRKTMKSRLARSIQNIRQWCRKNRHKPVREQWEKLKAKVKGHYAYYGITGNFRSLGNFLNLVERQWRHWLNCRNRENSMIWEKFKLLLERYPLPLPQIIHSVFKSKR